MLPRNLLNAEAAILQEASGGKLAELLGSLKVVEEYHSPSHIHRRQWFNTDFSIKLDTWHEEQEIKTTCVPVRPEAMGGFYYVQITDQGNPVGLELLEGQSLPVNSFAKEIQNVESVLETFVSLPLHISAKTCAYFRVTRLPHCVPFIACTTTVVANLMPVAAISRETDQCLISVRCAGNDLLVDGILRN